MAVQGSGQAWDDVVGCVDYLIEVTDTLESLGADASKLGQAIKKALDEKDIKLQDFLDEMNSTINPATGWPVE